MQTLCINCDNNLGCHWKNDHVIQCNEHVASSAKSIVSTSSTIKINGDQASLCSTCINNSSCVFKQQELKTILCEEYQ